MGEHLGHRVRQLATIAAASDAWELWRQKCKRPAQVALRFFALYVACLVVGLLIWAGVVGGVGVLVLVAAGGVAVVAARAVVRRAGHSVDDGG